MDNNNGLQLEKLNVGYGKVPLLTGVDLSVERGKVMTLIGPNGSGKSTILKTVTRQLKSLGGKVILLGKDMQGLSNGEIAKMLSMVMTARPTPELMTCREMVGTGRYPYVGAMGLLDKDDWKKVDEALKMVHAKEVAQSYFDEISDGQRQRIMLARAICQEPDILVLDEPTSYLDMRFKLDILDNIRKLCRTQNIAVIMSLHELDLAMKISDIVACVNGKRIEKVGPPEEIFGGDYLQKLYQVGRESFNSLTGAIYFEGVKKEPGVFVIGGGGSAIPIYYKLQREGIPFAAGILWENDLEMDAARACASEVISVKAFESAREEDYLRALKVLEKCERVICATECFGEFNEVNRKLMEHAKAAGKLSK